MVETRQAGESIACDCGVQLAVPTLRQLRELPEVQLDASAAKAGPVWGFRQGVTTVLALLTIACLVIAGVSRYSERPVPTIDPVKYSDSVDRLVKNMTPLEGWQRWIDTYQPLLKNGFEVYEHPATASMQIALDWHRWIQRVALVLAAVFAAAALGMWFAGGSGSGAKA